MKGLSLMKAESSWMGLVPLENRCERVLLPLPPCEDTVRRQTVSADQTPNLLVPRSWTSRTVRNKCCFSHRVYGIFVMAAWKDLEVKAVKKCQRSYNYFIKLWLLKLGWQIKLASYANSHQLVVAAYRTVLKRMLSSSWAAWENANDSIRAQDMGVVLFTLYTGHPNSETYSISASILGFICNQRYIYLNG